MKGALAFDTSNYTTSVAWFSPDGQHQTRKLLEVPPGALGLRQQDALFQHIKRLPALVQELFSQNLGQTVAVGASTAPREAEGSYMPCFLAGSGHAQVTAQAMSVPFFPWSHQQGHLAAAAWGAGHLELLDRPFLAWHLSGGTTELLAVIPKGTAFTAEKLGGTTDISAGQLIDRTGLLLGLEFPAGRALDALAKEAAGSVAPYDVKVDGFTFSLSGMENKVQALVQDSQPCAEIARFVLDTLAGAIRRVTVTAQNAYPGWPVLCSGGVASNSRLRYVLTEFCQTIFAPPEYSTDNALGTAILTYRAWEGSHG